VKQGEIWYADLNPTQGSEQAGRRPVAIVSGNMMNDNLPVVIVIPLTSKLKHYKGDPIFTASSTNGLKSDSEGLVYHVRSISKERLVKKIGVMEKTSLDLILKTVHDLLKY
jgi:mRNA interferase MazF